MHVGGQKHHHTPHGPIKTFENGHTLNSSENERTFLSPCAEKASFWVVVSVSATDCVLFQFAPWKRCVEGTVKNMNGNASYNVVFLVPSNTWKMTSGWHHRTRMWRATRANLDWKACLETTRRDANPTCKHAKARHSGSQYRRTRPSVKAARNWTGLDTGCAIPLPWHLIDHSVFWTYPKIQQILIPLAIWNPATGLPKGKKTQQLLLIAKLSQYQFLLLFHFVLPQQDVRLQTMSIPSQPHSSEVPAKDWYYPDIGP